MFTLNVIYMNNKTMALLVSFFSAHALAAGNYAAVELTHVSPTHAESTWERANQLMPRYPVDLAMKGIVGCGVFKVNVNADGSSEQVTMLSSVPKRVIAKPAISIIKKWDWQLVPGKSASSEEKVIRLDFCMGGSTELEARKRCQQQATLTCE